MAKRQKPSQPTPSKSLPQSNQSPIIMHGSYARGDYKEQKDLAPDRKIGKKQLTQLAPRERTAHARHFLL